MKQLHSTHPRRIVSCLQLLVQQSVIGRLLGTDYRQTDNRPMPYRCISNYGNKFLHFFSKNSPYVITYVSTFTKQRICTLSKPGTTSSGNCSSSDISVTLFRHKPNGTLWISDTEHVSGALAKRKNGVECARKLLEQERSVNLAQKEVCGTEREVSDRVHSGGGREGEKLPTQNPLQCNARNSSVDEIAERDVQSTWWSVVYINTLHHIQSSLIQKIYNLYGLRSTVSEI